MYNVNYRKKLQVLHSQSLGEKPLSPWMIVKKDGTIMGAHCDCVAGLGGVCTHVAATAFVIDMKIRNLNEITRTGRKAYWMPPTNRPAEPRRVADIDFTVAAKKQCVTGEGMRMVDRQRENRLIPPMTSEETSNFLKGLEESGIVCVSHLVTRPFSEKLKEEMEKKKKFFIMSLYKEKYTHKSLEELQDIGKY